MEEFYRIEDGMWLLLIGGEYKYNRIGIIYDKGEDFDTLLKHGELESMRELFVSHKYSSMINIGCDIRLIEPQIGMLPLVNKALAISASKWLSYLEDSVNTAKSMEE